jgi:hypothetical protein
VNEVRFGFSPSRNRVMEGILGFSEEEIARGLRQLCDEEPHGYCS